MDESDLAREIHRRRLYGQAGAKKGQADSDARLCFEYGVTPTIDDFVSPGMALGIKDVSGRSVTAVFGDSDAFYVNKDLSEAFDIFVFSNGETLFGWLGSDLIQESPSISVQHRVSAEFLFHMPEGLDFVPPNLLVPRVWDYRVNGWWTATGLYIYDSSAAKRIGRIDEELLG